MGWLGSILALALAFISGSAVAQQKIITYEPTNLTISATGNEVVGDIAVVRNSGVNEVVPFHATPASVSTPGSIYLPPLNQLPVRSKIVGSYEPPGGPPVQPNPAWVLVPPALCIVMHGMIRGQCSFDCRKEGVESWDSGFCGQKSTCKCKPDPEEPEQPSQPPTPREPGEGFPMGHFPYTQLIIGDYWEVKPRNTGH